MRRGITLIELLFVTMILAILGAMAFGVYGASLSQAKVERTRVIVAKLDQFISAKWESYRTRQLPIRIPAGADPIAAAAYRLNAMRELQRCELPDRITDVQTAPSVLPAVPSVQKSFRRRAAATWSASFEGAECLYLILAAMRDGENAALDFLTPQEVGDTDSDGMNEILDGFRRPIEWIRWPAGYVQESGPVTPLTRDADKAPDYFDPLKVDARWRDADTTFQPYALKPLIYSPGPDGEYRLHAGIASSNDPYVNWDMPPMIGTPDISGGWQDNITSHDFGEK